MEIVYRKLSELKPNPKNPRKGTKEAIEKLAESIKGNPKFFEARPILLSDRTGQLVIIGGERRSEAAALLKLETVPTILMSGLNEAQEDEILIKDNTHAGVWDEQKLQAWGKEQLQGWNVDGVKWPKSEPEIKEDNFDPDKKVKSRVKPGELWQLGKHRLMCGDSTKREDVEKLTGGVKIDMCFTDPPYNIDYVNIKHPKFVVRHIENDNMTTEEYKLFSKKIAEILKQTVRFCVYVCGAPGRDGRTLFAELDKTITNSTVVVWNKDVFTLGRGKYQNKYEPIWFGWVENGTSFTDDRSLANVWDIARPKASQLHPTMKPIELITTAMAHNPTAKTIIDLFGGSGSTLIAAEQMKRDCYTMELDPHYCDVIIDRWEEFSGQKAKLIKQK